MFDCFELLLECARLAHRTRSRHADPAGRRGAPGWAQKLSLMSTNSSVRADESALGRPRWNTYFMATGKTRHNRALHAVRDFFHRAYHSGMTGLAAMLAYNMLLAIVPLALLGLFIGGHILSSHTITDSVQQDLKDVFPGTTKQTLQSLLHQVQTSTTATGVLSLIFSLWVASSFWGALDTSFARIYHCPSRPWIKQKRFGILMVGVVVLFMISTVALPTMQSLLKSAASNLPIDLRHINDAIYLVSLVGSAVILFCCLSIIYRRVPNRKIPWRGVWRGALAATVAIAVIAYAFPLYLSSISTIARFGTTVVFVVIVLGWFYAVALIILGGAIVNAMVLGY
jgi:membrane protein